MRKTKTLSPVRGRRYRLTRLDSCGTPIYGDDGNIITSGVVSAAMTIVTNDEDEIRSTNSNGDTCLLIPATSKIDAVSAEITLCGMNPDFFEIATGMPIVYDVDGVAVGVVVDTDVDTDAFSFALEIWTGAGGDDACGEVGDVNYGYLLLQYMKGGRLSDFTVENGAINFVITGATSRRGGGWGRGPYNVVANAGVGDARVPGPLLVALTNSQPLLAIYTTVAPPAASDVALPTLDRSWVTLTSIDADATDGDMDIDFTVTPSPLTGQGVYYDFGDGEWEYVTEDSGDWTHTYAEAGTYTATAQVGGGVVVSVAVVVPFDAS